MTKRQQELFSGLPSKQKHVSDYPDLFAEWHPTKNGRKVPEDFTHGSNKKVWWKCTEGHEWNASIVNRSKGRGCPFCANKLVCSMTCCRRSKPMRRKAKATRAARSVSRTTGSRCAGGRRDWPRSRPTTRRRERPKPKAVRASPNGSTSAILYAATSQTGRSRTWSRQSWWRPNRCALRDCRRESIGEVWDTATNAADLYGA